MLSVKPREALKNISPFKTARSLEAIKKEYGVDKVIKLAGNETNLGPSPKAQEAVLRAVGDLYLYPDGQCTALREKLSRLHNVPPQRLIFGNGSFELLSVIAHAFLEEGDEAITPVPSFGYYKTATLEMGGVVVPVPLKEYHVDLEGIQKSLTPRTKIIWLCNPNNPTGTVIGTARLETFLEEIGPQVLVVFDEAYYDYAESRDYLDTIQLLNRHNNIICLRTFSKIYGLASSRIGYGVAQEELLDILLRTKLPNNVNRLAQAAALASLDDADFRQAVLENNRRGKALYYSRLPQLNLEYIPTHGNFIMFNTGLPSDYVVDQFVRKGILIRGGDEFGMPSWLRITIGLPAENEAVLELIEELVRKGEPSA